MKYAAGLLVISIIIIRGSSSYPSVAIFLIDDFGYADSGAYGLPPTVARTPNIDRLAEEGARFTDFSVMQSVCSPSRMSTLTGRYGLQTGVTKVLKLSDGIGLEPEERTFAATLRPFGVSSAFIGKWHGGLRGPDGTVERAYWPTRHGFDYSFWVPFSLGYTPLPLREQEVLLSGDVANRGTLLDRYTAQAKGFIATAPEPWVLVVAHSNVHVPHHIPERFATRDASSRYWDAVEAVDWAVGEVVDALPDNTVVVFTSDNGPQANVGGSAGVLRGHKGSSYEGGVRVPLIVRGPGVVHRTVTAPAMNLDLFATVLDIYGAPVPDRSVHGRSLWPTLTGAGSRADEPRYYWEGRRVSAMREGSWKLHLATDSKPAELYDLATDVGESINLAAALPERVQDMTGRARAFKQALLNDPHTVAR